MDDLLEQQLVNELRFMLQSVNEKYKDFFHIELLTLCNMNEMKCGDCIESTTGQQCKRCVIGVTEVNNE
jgi:hypothetical protein